MRDCSLFITLALDSQQKMKSHLHYRCNCRRQEESFINTSIQQSRLLGLTVLKMLLLRSFRHQIVVEVPRATLTLYLLKLREHTWALAKTWEQLSPIPAKLRLVPSLLMLPAPNSPSSHPTLSSNPYQVHCLPPTTALSPSQPPVLGINSRD